MELSEFITKEKEIEQRKVQLNKEIYNLNEKLDSLYEELDSLYETAWKNGFVWDSSEKKWYKESEN